MRKGRGKDEERTRKVWLLLSEADTEETPRDQFGVAEPTEAIPQSPSRPSPSCPPSGAKDLRSKPRRSPGAARRRDPLSDSGRALSMQERGFWGSKADQTAPGAEGRHPPPSKDLQGTPESRLGPPGAAP